MENVRKVAAYLLESMKKFLEAWWGDLSPDTLYGGLAVIGATFLFVVVIGVWASWLMYSDISISRVFKVLTLPTGTLLLSATIFYLTEYKGGR